MNLSDGPSFFRGQDNVSVYGGQMSMTVNYPAHEEERRLWSLLYNHVTLTAQFDSKERFSPPKCAESTREAILKQLIDWVNDDIDNPTPAATPNTPTPPSASAPYPAQIFWLHGGAGAGKSALAQSLAEKMKEKDNLAASFFFFSIEASRNNGDKLIPTLVQQLTTTFDGLQRFVLDKIRQDQHVFERSREAQMKLLLVEPLQAFYEAEMKAASQQNAPPPRVHPRLIIVDGMDECKDLKVQCDLLEIIARYLPMLPYPLRFLIASRPEAHIVRTFDHSKPFRSLPVSIQRYDLSKDSDANKDIRKFLDQEFEKITQTHPVYVRSKLPNWPTEDDLNKLVDRSSGHFVYPATVVRYVHSERNRPDERLRVILGLHPPRKNDQPFVQLDALYSLIFTDVSSDELENIQRGFGILYLISEKIGYFEIYRSGSSRIIQDMLKRQDGDMVLLFDPLRSLVAQEDDEENLHVFHKTLFDYLLDISRSQEFGLHKNMCHESAALYILNTEILSNWSYAPDYMYFGFHCILAQPLHDEGLKKFLQSFNILYDRDRGRTKGLLSLFASSGEQVPGIKTIFYVLRLMAQLKDLGDLHKTHSSKIEQYYIKRKSRKPTNGMNTDTESVDSQSGASDAQTNLNQKLDSEFNAWVPPEEGDLPTEGDSRDEIIQREHQVISTFVKTLHVENKDFTYRSVLLDDPAKNYVHCYHYFYVENDEEPTLVVVYVTYARYSDAATCSAASYDVEYNLKPMDKDSDFDKNLTGHLERAKKELVLDLEDVYEERFTF